MSSWSTTSIQFLIREIDLHKETEFVHKAELDSTVELVGDKYMKGNIGKYEAMSLRRRLKVLNDRQLCSCCHIIITSFPTLKEPHLTFYYFRLLGQLFGSPTPRRKRYTRAQNIAHTSAAIRNASGQGCCRWRRKGRRQEQSWFAKEGQGKTK